MTMFPDAMMLAALSGSAPPAFIASSTTSTFSGTTMNIARPAVTVLNDHLLMFVWGNSMLSCSSSGWTTIASDFVGTQTYAILRRPADGLEGSNFSISTGGGGDRNASILQYRGGIGAVDVIGAATEASSTTSTAASFTAMNAGVLIASFMQLTDGRTVATPPAGMTQRSLNNGEASVANYDVVNPAGATGARSLIWSGNGSCSGIALQIY